MGIFISLLAVSLLIAVALIRWGWQGKRVGTYPSCGACGFNLTGRPADSQRCSECGADLSLVGAIAIGARRRRVVPLSLGLGLLGLLLALTPGLSRNQFAAVREFQPIRYMPVFWLVRDYGVYPRGEAATTELRRRVAAGEFDDEDFESFAERVLAVPPGSQSHGTYGYLELALRGWKLGQLRTETAQRLVHHQNQFRFDVPEFVRVDRVPTHLSSYLRNAVQAARLDLHIAFEPGTLYVDGKPRHWEHKELSGNQTFGKVLPEWAFPPGVETPVRLRTTATITLTGGAVPIVDTTEVDLEAKTLVVAPENFKRPVSRVTELTQTAATVEIFPERNSFDISLAVDVWPRDVAFTGDAYISLDGEEAKLGEFQFQYGGRYVRFGPFDAVPDRPFKVILRPVPERYMDSFDRTPTYQQEIVIDEPVIRRN